MCLIANKYKEIELKTIGSSTDEPSEPEIDHIEVEFRPKLLTVAEVAARLGVKPSWVYAHADELGVYRMGKYLRFSWDRVVSGIEAMTATR